MRPTWHIIADNIAAISVKMKNELLIMFNFGISVLLYLFVSQFARVIGLIPTYNFSLWIKQLKQHNL